MAAVTFLMTRNRMRYRHPHLHRSRQYIGRLRKSEQDRHQKDEAAAGKGQVHGIFFSHDLSLYKVEAFRLNLFRWYPQMLQR